MDKNPKIKVWVRIALVSMLLKTFSLNQFVFKNYTRLILHTYKIHLAFTRCRSHGKKVTFFISIQSIFPQHMCKDYKDIFNRKDV